MLNARHFKAMSTTTISNGTVVEAGFIGTKTVYRVEGRLYLAGSKALDAFGFTLSDGLNVAMDLLDAEEEREWAAEEQERRLREQLDGCFC